MRVRMLASMAGPEVSFNAGDEHDFSDDEGKRLVESGYAEAVKEDKKPADKKPAEKKAAPPVTMTKTTAAPLVEKAAMPEGDVEKR